MSAVLSATQDTFELLPPTEQPKPTALPSGMTVIDAQTHKVEYIAVDGAILVADANRMLESAKGIVIDSQDLYVEAAEFLQKVVGRRKTLDEERLAATKPLRERTTAINGDYTTAIDTLGSAETMLKQQIAAWDRKVREEEERVRREAERVAAEQRRAQEAEAERARAAAAAEAKRIEDAAKEQARIQREAAEAAEREAAAARAAGDAAAAAAAQKKQDEASQAAAQITAQAEEQAATVVANGQAESESLQAAAEMTTAFVPQTTRVAVRGVSTRMKWTAEVEDKRKLLEYVLQNYETLHHLVDVNTQALTSMAQSQMTTFRVAGAVARQVPVVASGRR